MSIVGKSMRKPSGVPIGHAEVHVTRLDDKVIAEYCLEGKMHDLDEINTDNGWFEGALIQIASRALRQNNLLLVIESNGMRTVDTTRHGNGYVTHV